MKGGASKAILLAIGFVACDAGRAPFRQLDSTSALVPVTFRSPVGIHAMQGARMRDAVVRGDLDALHDASRALLQLILSAEQPAPQTTLGEVVAVTRRLEATEDLPAAARTFAVLAERCGACHAAFGGPRSLPAVAPLDTGTVAGRMQRHQWGAARLWEGLVAPSDEAWQSGAVVLSDAPLAFGLDAAKIDVGEVERLSTLVHKLGGEARASTTPRSRLEVYGELLTTCSACHAKLGGGPPGPRQ